jgi:ketosteroid isomerase-like protein
VRGAPTSDLDRSRKREVVDAFIAAARAGDFEALVAVLDPDVVVRCDAGAIELGGPVGMRGAAKVAEFFKGKAHSCVPGLVDGEVGILVPFEGRMLFVLELTFDRGRITAIDAVADLDTIESLDVERIG